MVRIVRSQDQPTAQGAPISTRNATAVAGATARFAGRAREIGNQWFNQSMDALQTSQYSSAISQAVEQYGIRATERMQQATDDEGNPTFGTIAQDVEAIGQEVKAEAGGLIFNPAVRSKFDRAFAQIDLNHRTKAIATGRNQQLQFGRANLNSDLRKLGQGSLNDPSEIKFLQDQANQIVDASLSSGMISPVEAGIMKDDFRKNAYMEVYRNMIEANPTGTKQLLGGDLDQLQLREKERDSLVREADARIRDEEIAARRLQNKIDTDTKNSQAALTTSLEIGILDETVGGKEVEESREGVGEKNYLKLRRQLATERTRATKQDITFGRISDALVTGRDTFQFSAADIDSHFNALIDAHQAQKEDGSPVTMVEKLALSAPYGRPIRSLGQQVNSGILHGADDQAREALEAYIVSGVRKSRSLTGPEMTKGAIAVAEYSKMLITKAGMQPREAITAARDTIRDRDDIVQKDRAKVFSKLDSFNPENLAETINSDHDLEGTITGFNVGIDANVSNTYKTLVREAYLNSGDIESAQATAFSQMSQSGHGVTEINDEEQYTQFPVELVYPNSTIEQVRTGLETDPDIVSKLPEGVKPEQLKVKSNDLTGSRAVVMRDAAGNLVNQRLVTYSVVYTKDIDGVETELPLVNPETGDLVRWMFVPPSSKQKVEKAEKENLELIRKRAERKERSRLGRIALENL